MPVFQYDYRYMYHLFAEGNAYGQKRPRGLGTRLDILPDEIMIGL